MELSWKLMLYQTLNFIVLMVVLGYIFNRFIRPFLQKRTNHIKSSFEEIDTQKKGIESIRADLARQLDDIKEKAKQEMEKAIEDGNRSRDKLIRQAHEDTLAMRSKNMMQIEDERRVVIRELRADIARLSIAVAEKIVERTVDEKVNDKYIAELLAKIDEKHLSS